jgi:rhodanese-related sulfurtransferase
MPESVTREEVQILVHNGAQLVEVLDGRQYGKAHLPGAINIPLPNFDRKSAAALTHERPVIVYCHDFQ